MNQTPCNVIRDLMPLCIDKAGSEESAALVETHLAECEACRACYEKMQAELPTATDKQAQAEAAAFGHTAELMKLKRRLRTGKTILLGILIGCLLVLGSLFAFNALYLSPNAELPVTAYGVSLSQLKDGRVVINMDYKGSKRAIFPQFMTSRQVTPKAGRPLTATVSVDTTLIPRAIDGQHAKGPLSLPLRSIEQYGAIYAGENRQKLVWKNGDLIPAASEEMEAFYALAQQLDHYENDIFAQSMEGPVISQIEQMDEMSDRLSELRGKVPEWQ